MQIVQFATPVQATAEQRYVTLHRTIDQGLGSNRTLLQLGRVCLELRKQDEALSVFYRLPHGVERTELARELRRAGLIKASPEDAHRFEERQIVSTARDEVLDAARFLFDDHMPLTLVAVTAGFPILMGLGALLTMAGLPPVAQLGTVALVAVVLGSVLAFASTILREAAAGMEDPPALPALVRMLKLALPACGRFLAVVVAAVAPAVSGMLLSGDLVLQACLWGLAAVAFPAMYASVERMRSVSGLSPVVWGTWMLRCGKEYWVAAAAIAVLLAPATVVMSMASGSALHLQVALAGPLFAGPMLAVARLLGRLQHRFQADAEVEQRIARIAAEVAAAAEVRNPATAAERRSITKRRAARRSGARPAPAARRPGSPTQPPVSNNRIAAAVHAERERRMQQARPADGEPALVAASAAGGVEAEEVPNLAQMPGFRVVREADRHRLGASAAPPRPRPRPHPLPPVPRRR